MKERNTVKMIILGLQHVAAMFGSTVLVPMLTGLHPGIALFGAGVGTLIFHGVTKRKMPVFLGSSFAFIVGIQHIGSKYGLPYATGGILVAGIMYLLFAGLIHLVGMEKVKKLFPPLITGTMIMIIGLTLAPSVINGNIVDAQVGTLGQRWLVATVVVLIVVIISKYTKGFIKLLPILIGVTGGYLLAQMMGMTDIVLIKEAKWLTLPPFILPKFNWEAVAVIAPISIVTAMEHIGDVTTVGNVVGKDFLGEVGLTKTFLGDGLATIFAGLVGAPANTTYSENTGVLAITKVYDPIILEIAAIFAILLSFIGKLGAVLQSIPGPVMGGASIILFGMIASTGIRTLISGQVNLSNSKNSIIVAIMLVLGLSGVTLPIGGVSFSGMSLSAIIGILLNVILPE